MGFRGLCPADKLGAFYDPAKQTLTISASGEVQKFSYGYNFVRDAWIGGLKFEFYCWTGPLGQGKEHFEYSQGFPIALPSPVFPSDEIIVVTANHPKGVRVPIRYGGFRPPSCSPPADIKDLAIAGPHTASPTTTTIGAVHINALFREPFDIKAHAEVPKGGSVNITFDPTYLIIQNAGIDDQNIVWTFNSLQTGNTQVIVTTYGGIANFVMRKVYDVRIFVLDNAAANLPKGDDDAILSFLGRVNIAVRIVTEAYPGAQLYDVEAQLPAGIVYPVTNPVLLSHLRCIFRTKDGTVFIQSTGWGEWASPTYVPEPIIGNATIPWPVKMGIEKAAETMKKQGITMAFWSCVLKYPLGPSGKPFDEPYYVFRMVDTSSVFVGVNDGAVIHSKTGQDTLPSSE